MDSADDRTIAARLEKATAEIGGLSTQFDAFRFLKRFTEARGLRAFMVMAVPGTVTQVLSTHTLLTNWPAELINRYDRDRLLPESPVFIRLRETSLPFHFDARADGQAPAYADLFERYGMRHSLWFPVYGASGERGAVSFSGENPPGPLDLFELSWISTALHEQLLTIDRKIAPARELLTERETACLLWTSEGKTSADIAEILNLSEHTVNHYLNRVTRKLDAVNRTQAVAKALRQNIIE